MRKQRIIIELEDTNEDNLMDEPDLKETIQECFDYAYGDIVIKDVTVKNME